jgi:hypothetical protein
MYVGETVVCNTQDILHFLTVEKKYRLTASIHNGSRLSFCVSDFRNVYFPSYLFISLIEYRKLKLEKLNENR